MNDDRQYAPATLRNRDFILDVLRDVLPTTGAILEIASGSGEHIVHFARNLPDLVFQPSDPDPDARLSVAAWASAEGVANVHAPLALDVSEPVWPIASADGVICINMVHISPWEATLGLMRWAAAVLPPGAPLYLYGPYLCQGILTAPSNQAFDRSLRDRNPNWGLRDLGVVAAMAQSVGFSAPVKDLNSACRSRLIDPTLRPRLCLTAVELLADRRASPRPESDAAPSALEMG